MTSTSLQSLVLFAMSTAKSPVEPPRTKGAKYNMSPCDGWGLFKLLASTVGPPFSDAPEETWFLGGVHSLILEIEIYSRCEKKNGEINKIEIDRDRLRLTMID